MRNGHGALSACLAMLASCGLHVCKHDCLLVLVEVQPRAVTLCQKHLPAVSKAARLPGSKWGTVVADEGRAQLPQPRVVVGAFLSFRSCSLSLVNLGNQSAHPKPSPRVPLPTATGGSWTAAESPRKRQKATSGHGPAVLRPKEHKVQTNISPAWQT